jgi:hypothetical protein
MESPSPVIEFLAVLIYDEGNGRLCEEPRVYSATHPEIAFQLALVDGNEERFGRKFLGLSHLEATTQEIAPIAHSRKGSAQDLVVPKESLEAFSDARWKGLPCSEPDLAEALREPPPLFEIEGLNAIAWDAYTHAYGPASEVPTDLRRLVSSDSERRRQALWQLGGSIYHQGSIYGATAVAVPFLLRIASDPRLPDRSELFEFIVEIAKSSSIHPDRIRKNWAWRRDNLGGFFANSSDEMAAREIRDVSAVRQAFINNIELIRRSCVDNEPGISQLADSLLKEVERPVQPPPSCAHCRDSGECYCKRTGGSSVGCKRCKGSGRCHVCHGTRVG